MTKLEFVAVVQKALEHMDCDEIAEALNGPTTILITEQNVRYWSRGGCLPTQIDLMGARIEQNLEVFLAKQKGLRDPLSVDFAPLDLKRSSGKWSY